MKVAAANNCEAAALQRDAGELLQQMSEAARQPGSSSSSSSSSRVERPSWKSFGAKSEVKDEIYEDKSHNFHWKSEQRQRHQTWKAGVCMMNCSHVEPSDCSLPC